jgi:MFS superfamily sulfate permease-like transporter
MNSDGMASCILAGVNPIYGLYACMVGPVAGGIFSSTRLMIIAATSAASLSVGALYKKSFLEFRLGRTLGVSLRLTEPSYILFEAMP